MTSILDKCAGVPREHFAPGTILISEGETSGRLYILAEGSVEVLRGDTQVAAIGEAGSVFGEMSVLLNRPHTATVRATTPVDAFVFEDAESFLKSNPEIAFFWVGCSPSASTPRRPISSTSSGSSRDRAIIWAWSARSSKR